MSTCSDGRLRLGVGEQPLYLLTNDFERPATDIAQLYKERWEIELLFKWLKQNLKIRRFLGRSENSVRIQIYVALIAFLLLHILHHHGPLVQGQYRAAPHPPQTRPLWPVQPLPARNPAAQTTGVAPAQPANLLRLPMSPIRHKIPDSSALSRG
jgi:Transposase DDE domain